MLLKSEFSRWFWLVVVLEVATIRYVDAATPCCETFSCCKPCVSTGCLVKVDIYNKGCPPFTKPSKVRECYASLMGNKIVTAAFCLSHPDTFTIKVTYSDGVMDSLPKNAITIAPGYDGNNVNIGYVPAKNCGCIKPCCASCDRKDVVAGAAALTVGTKDYIFPVAPCCTAKIAAYRTCQEAYGDTTQGFSSSCLSIECDKRVGIGAQVWVGGNLVGFITTSSDGRVAKIFIFQQVSPFMNAIGARCSVPPPIIPPKCECANDRRTTLKKSACGCYWTCDCMLRAEIITTTMGMVVAKKTTRATLVADNRAILLASEFPPCWDHIIFYFDNNQERIPQPEKVEKSNTFFAPYQKPSVAFNLVVALLVNAGNTLFCKVNSKPLNQCKDLRGVSFDAPKPYVSTYVVKATDNSVCGTAYADDAASPMNFDGGCVLGGPFAGLGGGIFCDGEFVAQLSKTPTPNVACKPAEIEIPSKLNLEQFGVFVE